MKNNDKQMPAFMVFRETALMLKLMPDEQAGQIVKAAVRCFLHGEVAELSGDCAEVLQTAMDGVDKSRMYYEKKSDAGAKGAAARWHKAD